ncbi:alpha-ketoglutarate-dependent dioxygenase AlkB family protein [Azomonas macrocytogenes]|uniref:Alkylated DNA repair dioxygenase AlkB n=1 Tax=Azomonas macrocytogenes TaxID=69962 RepID=A0A839T144_AZOMA|nr:alpha-ketoglutarate-dependent dioxygenase AlkB [Azomonas macrocytogenes]MBB3102290.1 alkylated DNA repair dioxygenase AlkB [Azomonas macrocytogenes]
MPDVFSDGRIRLPNAELAYFPDWLSTVEADGLLAEIVAQTPWAQPRIRCFGREHAVPRLVAWYGDPQASYCYSGLAHSPLPWIAPLDELRKRLQAELQRNFNGVLLNLYRNGQDAMGWHSDDEPELGADPLIASLSLGAERRFDLRRTKSKGIQHSLILKHGSLLVMSGSTQHYWQHQIARTRKINTARLNLTFRLIHSESKQ